jgi:hypothetical protein
VQVALEEASLVQCVRGPDNHYLKPHNS